VSPSGCAGATDTASTLAVTAGKGCTVGSSGQLSSDDHTGKAGLLAFGRQTHPIDHFGVDLVVVPSSIHTAIVDPNWGRAMEEEFAALITNNTWDLVPRPVGSNVITDKWIFKHKFNFDGSLERYKAHWVLHGFTQ
jgi:hypothetical protein